MSKGGGAPKLLRGDAFSGLIGVQGLALVPEVEVVGVVTGTRRSCKSLGPEVPSLGFKFAEGWL